MGVSAADSIQSVVDSVFRQRIYDRTVSQTVWETIREMLDRLLRSLFGSLRAIPGFGWLVIGAAVAVLIAIVSRVAYASAARRKKISASYAPGKDPWGTAFDLAAKGDYLEAAHYLYLALIEAVAQRHRISLHPAKTIGDYSRDLKRVNSDVLPTFRDFRREYEPIIWGGGACTPESYERLRSLTAAVRDAA